MRMAQGPNLLLPRACKPRPRNHSVANGEEEGDLRAVLHSAQVRRIWSQETFEGACTSSIRQFASIHSRPAGHGT